ncbi:MAG: hypothetical protein K6G12_09970 [Lachnospiraceae bacterium]|nr:hypothetical protein [Lachnospiraceae bacterium]
MDWLNKEKVSEDIKKTKTFDAKIDTQAKETLDSRSVSGKEYVHKVREQQIPEQKIPKQQMHKQQMHKQQMMEKNDIRSDGDEIADDWAMIENVGEAEIKRRTEAGEKLDVVGDGLILLNIQKEKEYIRKNGGKADKEADRVNELRQKLRASKGMRVNRAVSHIPQSSALRSSFRSRVGTKERLSKTKRSKKIYNPKSRLFQKAECARTINQCENLVGSRMFDDMTEAMNNRRIGCDKQTFHDLSVFMYTKEKDVENNRQLLDLYLGTSRDQKTGEIVGRDRNAALDIITKRLFGIDVSDINFEDDKHMVQSAQRLEALVGYVGAYDRLMRENPDYLEGLGDELREKISERMQELRSVSAYYIARKELLNDELYRTHYDDELSMKIDENSTDEERALAEKLVNAYVLGQNFIRINKNPHREMINPGDLKMMEQLSEKLQEDALKKLDPDGLREYVEKAYASGDYLAGGIRIVAHNIPLTGGEDWKLKSEQGLTDSKTESKMKQYEREDMDYIQQEVQKRIGKNALQLKNPYTGHADAGLALNRIYHALNKYNSGNYGTDDLIEILCKMFAPAAEKNQRLDPESNEVKQLNSDFKWAVNEYKKILLNAYRCLDASFGDLLGQLSVIDGAALFRNYGDKYTVYSGLEQDALQIVAADEKASDKYFDEDNPEDSEFIFRLNYFNEVVSVVKIPFVFVTANRKSDLEYMLTNTIEGKRKKNSYIYTHRAENNKLLKGPSMSRSQMADYKKQLKTKMSENEYKNYIKRVDNINCDIGQAFDLLWDRKQLESYKNYLKKNGYNSGEMPGQIKTSLEILSYMKTTDIWTDPFLIKNKELRDKVIYARENVLYLEKIAELSKESTDLVKRHQNGVMNDDEYEAAQKAIKEKAGNINSVSNDMTLAYAHENALREVPVSVVPEYSDEALREAWKDFENINIESFAFSDYDAIIRNYHYNLELCKKAEVFEGLLTQALLSGKTLDDKTMLPLRAKLRFMHQISVFSQMLNDLVCADPSFGIMTEQQKKETIEKAGEGMELKIYPTGNIASLYKKFLTDIKDEHANRSDMIRAAYYPIDKNVPLEDANPGEDPHESTIPKAELARRKKDFQKNAFIFDHLSRQKQEYTNSCNRSIMAIRADLARKGQKIVEPDRTDRDMFAYRTPAEAIELYRKLKGTDDERLEFYTEMYNEVKKVNPKDYELKNFQDAYADSKIREKMRAAYIGSNLNTLEEKFGKLVKDGKYPDGYNSLEDFRVHLHATYNVFTTYSNRLTALTTLGETSANGALSLDDYKKMNIKEVLIRYNHKTMQQDEEHFMASRLYQPIAGLMANKKYLANDDDPEGPVTGFDEDLESVFKADYDYSADRYREELRRAAAKAKSKATAEEKKAKPEATAEEKKAKPEATAEEKKEKSVANAEEKKESTEEEGTILTPMNTFWTKEKKEEPAGKPSPAANNPDAGVVQEKYTKAEKARREKILKDHGIPVPKDRDELVVLRSNHYRKEFKIIGQDGVLHTDFTWNDDVSAELRENYDWLMRYYRSKDKTLRENVKAGVVDIPKYKDDKVYNVKMNIPGMGSAYESQGTLNCFACAGSAMVNQYIARRKGEKKITRRVNQYDFRAFRPMIRKYDEEKFGNVIDKGTYSSYVKDVNRYAGAGKRTTGTIFEMGDFIMEKLEGEGIKDVMLNKTVFILPGVDETDKRDDVKLSNQRVVFKQKLNEIISGGSVAGMLTAHGTYAHYITLTGINGDNVEYYDSYPYSSKPKYTKVDELMKRGDRVELNWISEKKTAEEMTEQYPNLIYDVESGYEVKEYDDNLIGNTAAHTRGITVKREEDDLDPGMEGITEMVYIPDEKMHIEKETIEENLNSLIVPAAKEANKKTSDKKVATKKETNKKVSAKKEELKKESEESLSDDIYIEDENISEGDLFGEVKEKELDLSKLEYQDDGEMDTEDYLAIDKSLMTQAKKTTCKKGKFSVKFEKEAEKFSEALNLWAGESTPEEEKLFELMGIRDIIDCVYVYNTPIAEFVKKKYGYSGNDVKVLRRYAAYFAGKQNHPLIFVRPTVKNGMPNVLVEVINIDNEYTTDQEYSDSVSYRAAGIQSKDEMLKSPGKILLSTRAAFREMRGMNLPSVTEMEKSLLNLTDVIPKGNSLFVQLLNLYESYCNRIENVCYSPKLKMIDQKNAKLLRSEANDMINTFNYAMRNMNKSQIKKIGPAIDNAITVVQKQLDMINNAMESANMNIRKGGKESIEKILGSDK